MTGDSQPAVRDNPAEHRYELVVDGKVAGFVLYRPIPGALELVHTEVDPAFEGQGMGGRLARGALDAVRKRGLQVVPSCPFIASTIRRHPEYADLVVTPDEP